MIYSRISSTGSVCDHRGEVEERGRRTKGCRLICSKIEPKLMYPLASFSELGTTSGTKIGFDGRTVGANAIVLAKISVNVKLTSSSVRKVVWMDREG
jgi:hypothetical protein